MGWTPNKFWNLDHDIVKKQVCLNFYMTITLIRNYVDVYAHREYDFLFERENYQYKRLNSCTQRLFFDKVNKIWVCCWHLQSVSKTCNGLITSTVINVMDLVIFPCNTFKIVLLLIIFKFNVDFTDDPDFTNTITCKAWCQTLVLTIK